MDGSGFLIFAGILAKVLLFTASIFITTFLVDITSTKGYRWTPAAVIGAAILTLAIKPDLVVSVIQSFTAGLSWDSIRFTILGGVAAGGALSGI